MNKVKVKKIANVLGNVLLYLLLALCIFSVLITILSKKDSDGAIEVFGYQVRVVTTNSMDKCEYTDVSDFKIKSIPQNSLVFVKLVPEDEKKADEWYSKLQVGDVLTFRYVYTTQITITHRITEISKNERGGYDITLAGDNVNSDSKQLYQEIDTSVSDNTNYVIGKVTGQSRVLGFFISLLKNPLGIVFLIIIPCFIIILFEVLKIVNVLNADKKKLAQEEAKKKDSELEELRRKLATLENSNKKEASEKSEDPSAKEPSDKAKDSSAEK